MCPRPKVTTIYRSFQLFAYNFTWVMCLRVFGSVWINSIQSMFWYQFPSNWSRRFHCHYCIIFNSQENSMTKRSNEGEEAKQKIQFKEKCAVWNEGEIDSIMRFYKKKNSNERTAIKLMQHMFVTVFWIHHGWGCLDSELDFFSAFFFHFHRLRPRSLSHVQMD